VEEWFSQGEHNIAMVTGSLTGIVVVDGDSATACDYIESIVTPTPMVVQSAKGRHYYFRHPGGRVPNSVRVVEEPPIDLRGDGGLIIGPGSLHASGVHYQMAEGFDLAAISALPVFKRDWFSMEHAKVQEFHRPTVLFTGPAQKDVFEQAKRYLRNVPGAIGGSGGDQATYIQACRLVRGFNLSDEEALSILFDWNSTCLPPWDEADLRAKVRHARLYGTGEFGSMLMRENIRNGLVCYGWPLCS
jgi:hypothetical protein